MKLNFPPVLLNAAVSAAAGVVAVSLLRHSQALAGPQDGRNTGGAQDGAGASVADPVGIQGHGKGQAKEKKNEPDSPASQRELAARFRVLLGQLGIDPSWAEDLSAPDTSGFADLLEKMKTLPDLRRGQLREFLLGRWALLDPEGGAEFFQSRKDEDGLADFFRQWQRLDFPAAVAKAEEHGEKILRRTLREKALLDPAGLLAWLAERPDLNPLSIFNSGGEENTRALTRMAETDPDKMLAWERQLPEDKWDQSFIKALAAQLAKHSPEESVAWAKSIKDPARSAAALTGVAGALAASSPERALSLLGALPEAGNYADRSSLYEAMRKVDVGDGKRAAELMKGMPAGEARAVLMHVALEKLLESDPAAVFALAKIPGLAQGVSWLSDNLPAAAKTPENARRILEAAGEAGESAYRESVSKEAVVNWLEKEPASLAAYLREKGDTPLLTTMRETIQTALAVQQRRDGRADPGLLALVGLPPEIVVKSQMLEVPESAARLLDTVEDSNARQLLAGTVARQYVYQDRNQAMAWAENVKDPEVRATALKTIAADWVAEDSWQASQWIAKLPEGKGRDSAVLAMAEGISKTDPDLAWKWALSMGDPDLKNQALSAAATAWAKKDASALHEALSDGTLSPPEQRAILDKLKNAPGAAH